MVFFFRHVSLLGRSQSMRRKRNKKMMETGDSISRRTCGLEPRMMAF